MSFANAMSFTARWEGGKIDDPIDPGGRTGIGGITQTSFNAFTGTQQDVWTATADQIVSFYRSYWDHTGGPGFDAVDPRLSVVMFDASFNHGNTMAIQFLQRAVSVLDDGQFGSVTLSALHDYYDRESEKLLQDLVQQRRDHYIARSIAKPPLQKYLHGWVSRCDDLLSVVGSSPDDLPEVVTHAHGSAKLLMNFPGIR